MAAQNNAAVLGLQRENMLKNASKLFSVEENTLQSKLMNNKGRVEQVSKRSLKIPLILKNGGKGRMFNSDGGPLGAGGAPTAGAAFVSTIGLLFATSRTTQAQWATDSKEKAIESADALDTANALSTFKELIDQLMNTAGDGVLATVTAVSGSTITVDNATQLHDGNDYLMVSGDGSYTVRGGANFTVDTVDPNLRQAFLTAAAPTGTIVGDMVVIDGGSGVPASSLLGIYATQVDANTGTWQGINRSTAAGRLKTPHVNASGATITPQMVILAKALMRRALGSKTPEEENFVWYGDLEQEASWQALALNSQQIQRLDLGKNAADVLTENGSPTIGGRPLFVSNHARRGRLDGLCLKHWGMAFTKELGSYKVGNQSVFADRDPATGYVKASQTEYLATECQVWNDNPMAGCFIDNIGATAGF